MKEKETNASGSGSLNKEKTRVMVSEEERRMRRKKEEGGDCTRERMKEIDGGGGRDGDTVRRWARWWERWWRCEMSVC